MRVVSAARNYFKDFLGVEDDPRRLRDLSATEPCRHLVCLASRLEHHHAEAAHAISVFEEDRELETGEATKSRKYHIARRCSRAIRI